MSGHQAEQLCGEVFQHLTLNLTTCTEPCIHSEGHRPHSAHRCVAGHEWFIDAQDFNQGVLPPLKSPRTQNPGKV